MIIDCHCHAGKGDGFHGPWDTEARIEPHLERARAAGIDKTIVFPVFNSDYAAANARLAHIMRKYPDELIGFASIHPARDAGRVELMVRRAVEDYGFRGLKIHGFDAFPGREVCEVARRYQLPLMVDVVGRLAAVEMLAWQYPDLNFIIPHLGGFKDDWMVHTHLVDQLRRRQARRTTQNPVRLRWTPTTSCCRAAQNKDAWASGIPASSHYRWQHFTAINAAFEIASHLRTYIKLAGLAVEQFF